MFKVKLAGIYKIEHKSGYYYIGMSIDIFSRWSNHYTDIKKEKHSSIEFMKLWGNTEPQDWSFSILEYVSMSEYKKTSKTKGKVCQDGFRKLLLKKEKEHMKMYSINYSLNKNNRYFS